MLIAIFASVLLGVAGAIAAAACLEAGIAGVQRWNAIARELALMAPLVRPRRPKTPPQTERLFARF